MNNSRACAPGLFSALFPLPPPDGLSEFLDPPARARATKRARAFLFGFCVIVGYLSPAEPIARSFYAPFGAPFGRLPAHV